MGIGGLLRALGVLLLLLGLSGPFTYADDLRHLGEMAAVVGLSLSGLCLLAPALPIRFRCRGSCPVASACLLPGLALGAALDQAMAGLLVGACIGIVAAWRHCWRHRDAAA